MFSLVNLLYPVWLASVFQQRARQIGGFLTARTKYMTGAPPANVEVKPPQTQNCPGAHTGAENARKPTFWPSEGFLTSPENDSYLISLFCSRSMMRVEAEIGGAMFEATMRLQ